MSARVLHQVIAFAIPLMAWSQCTLNPVPLVEASDGLNCPNSGGGLSISSLGGTPPYTFSVPPSTYLAGGTYAFWNLIMTGQMQVTDANGCQGVVYTHVTIVAAPIISNITTLPSCNSQATGSVTFQLSDVMSSFNNSVLVQNGAGQTVAQFTPGQNGTQTVLSLAAGSYSIRSIASYNGCTDAWNYPFTIAGNATNCNEVNLTLRAALQGALPTGTLMTDGLRGPGLIPSSEPYSALGYTYVGSSPGTFISTSLTVTGNDAIVDWVFVELRNAATPTQVVASKAALIQRDGDVVAPNGGTLAFAVPAANYHVALRHRNHLAVMTGASMALSSTLVTVDFRSAATACYGTAPRAQVGTVHCLWAGDTNGNGTIAYTGANNDRDPVLTAVGASTPNSTLSYQYGRLDVNMDGTVKYTGANNDRDIILTNVGSTTPNSTRTQQLP